MFSELVIAGMVAVTPISVENNLKKYEAQPIGLYADSIFKKTYIEELYSPLVSNSYNLVGSELSITSDISNKNINKYFIIFRNMVNELTIDFDEKHDYFSFLSNLRDNEEEYRAFLYESLNSGDLNVCNAISIFLSQKKYHFITADEENFIVSILRFGNLQMQEFALNAILNWDKVSDITGLKTIRLGNKYLQEDLEDFIQSKL